MNRHEVREVRPGPGAGRPGRERGRRGQAGQVGEAQDVGEHDDGHGAALVDVLARRGLRELRVARRDEGGGEKFVDGGGVFVFLGGPGGRGGGGGVRGWFFFFFLGGKGGGGGGVMRGDEVLGVIWEGWRGVQHVPVYLVVFKERDGAVAVIAHELGGHPGGGVDASGRGCGCVYV